MMRFFRSLTVSLLRIIATVFVLALVIGTSAISCKMIHAAVVQTLSPNKVLDSRAIAADIASFAIYTAVCSILLFPLGVFLHWIIAKRSNVHPYWVWWVIFTGSIVICFAFPVGTILGVITIWLLFVSDIFKKMRRCPGPGAP